MNIALRTSVLSPAGPQGCNQEEVYQFPTKRFQEERRSQSTLYDIKNKQLLLDTCYVHNLDRQQRNQHEISQTCAKRLWCGSLCKGVIVPAGPSQAFMD